MKCILSLLSIYIFRRNVVIFMHMNSYFFAWCRLLFVRNVGLLDLKSFLSTANHAKFTLSIGRTFTLKVSTMLESFSYHEYENPV